MHSDLVEIGWTEEQWNRIVTAVTDEAQKGRVAAQLLSVSGPEASKTVAVPSFRLGVEANIVPPNTPPDDPDIRLSVDSDPTLYLQTIAVNVQLRTREVGDPELKAALVMFRRAANLIVRLEDALIFQGRSLTHNPSTPFNIGLFDQAYGIGPNILPDTGVPTVDGNTPVEGIFPSGPFLRGLNCFTQLRPQLTGESIVTDIIAAIDTLESKMRLGPFACVLGHDLFEAICTPTNSMVMPRDRILPFLQGPLARSSAVPPNFGAVLSLGGSPIEIVVASDLCVRFLQTTLEPRFVFRVCERVALRIEDANAIQVLTP
jgi:uncharacterized linocin/CFP29 family protein